MASDDNDKAPVKGTALNSTRYTGIIAIIAPLGAALIALLGPLDGQKPLTIVAVYGAIAVGLLAAAIAASADVLARAWVTAASTVPKEQSLATPPGEPVALRVPGLHPEPIPVITARWDASEERTWYLVKEPGVPPVWIDQDQVKAD